VASTFGKKGQPQSTVSPQGAQLVITTVAVPSKTAWKNSAENRAVLKKDFQGILTVTNSVVLSFLEVARYQAVAVMDTMTYASVAALPWSVAQNSKYPVIPEPEFIPFSLSYIRR